LRESITDLIWDSAKALSCPGSLCASLSRASRRADAAERALALAGGRRARHGGDGLGRGDLQRAGGDLELGSAVLRQGRHRGLEGAHRIGAALAAEPEPDRRQRGAADLAGPDRGHIVDEEGFERMEGEPHRVVAAGLGVLARAADDLAQLLEHEIRHREVVAALDRALELAHQQGLRLRRQLAEIVPQSLDGRLAHGPETLTSPRPGRMLSCGRRARRRPRGVHRTF
jgi:hypothetical protein